MRGRACPETGDFLKDANDEELRNAIGFLIQRRERLRDEELARLEKECRQLLEKFQILKQAQVLEEVSCFRDILALHRKLVEKQEDGGGC